MRMYIFYLLFILGLKANSNAQITISKYGNKLDIRKCIEIALENNIEAKTGEITLMQKEVGLRQTKQNLLPSIYTNDSYAIGYGRGQTNSGLTVNTPNTKIFNISAGSSVVLSSGLALINSIKMSSLLFKAEKHDYQHIRNEISLNIIVLYFNALAAQELLKLSQLRASASTAILIKAKNLNDFGNIAYNDGVELEDAEIIERNAYKHLSVDSIYAIAIKNSPQTRASALRIETARKNISISKSKFYPSISTQIQSGYSNSSNQNVSPFWPQLRENRLYGPFVSLNLPILNSFQNRNSLKLTKLNLKLAESSDTRLRTLLNNQIREAYANMNSVFHRLLFFQKQVDAHKISYEAQLAKFQPGLLTSDLLITSKNHFDDYQNQFINAKYDYNIRRKILDYYEDRLL